MPRINTKLTDREIKEAKAKDKNYFLFDDGGLRLLVRPSGTKVWQYPYKFDGKNNIYTVGQYGNDATKVGAAQARNIRDEVKESLRAGIDPNLHKKNKKQRKITDAKNTFQSVAEQWYTKQSWTEKHAKNIKSRLEKDVFSIIGNTPIKDVSAADIVHILKKIETRNAVTVAQRINQYCSDIFEYGIGLSVCSENPALGRTRILKSHIPQNRKHIKESDLPEYLNNMYTYEELNITALAVKFQTLTLQRPAEIRTARWAEIDFKQKIWRIPAERMKMNREHWVPLPKQAIKILETIKRISGNYEILFPGKVSNRKPISDVSMIKMVKKFSNGKMTPHGIRHTAITILNDKGYNKDWVERQVSHLDDNKIRGTYNKAEYLEQRIKMMQEWADYLDNQLSQK